VVHLLSEFGQHVLPKGFMRIRHYGFLANACRKRKLALIKAQSTHKCKLVQAKPETESLVPHWFCQSCKVGILRFIGVMNSDTPTNEIVRTS